MPKGNSKKFGVYTKNEKGNVVIVRFGDPNMEIRRDDPKARKNFRSRHNCDNPGFQVEGSLLVLLSMARWLKVEGSIEESWEGWFYHD